MRIAVHEALVGRVLDKSGAEEHDVVKAPPKGAPQQVQKILCLARIRGAHNQGVEGQLSGVHASLYLCVCVCPGFAGPCVALCLVLNRFQLPAHDVHLRVGNGEDVAVCGSRAGGASFDL